MTNNRVGVSKMPNHRSVLELARRANTSLDATTEAFHQAIATTFADQVMEPEQFVRAWYEVAVAQLDDDQMEDMKERFTTYARIFFTKKNPYFAERLRQEYEKLLRSTELPVKPWKPAAPIVEQASQVTFEKHPGTQMVELVEDSGPKSIQQLRQERADYRDALAALNPALPDIVGIDSVEWDAKDVDSTSSQGGLPIPADIAEELNKAIETGDAIVGTPIDLNEASQVKRALPDNFDDMKINELRALAKRWDLPTADLRSKEDYRDALRAAVEAQ